MLFLCLSEKQIQKLSIFLWEMSLIKRKWSNPRRNPRFCTSDGLFKRGLSFSPSVKHSADNTRCQAINWIVLFWLFALFGWEGGIRGRRGLTQCFNWLFVLMFELKVSFKSCPLIDGEFCTKHVVYLYRRLCNRGRASRVAYFWGKCHAVTMQ